MSNDLFYRFLRLMVRNKDGSVFDLVMVSQAVGYEKPDRRIFELLLDRLQLPGPRVAMFGDNAIADGACRLLDIPFVLVTGYRNRDWAWERGDVHVPVHQLESINPEAVDRFLANWEEGRYDSG